MVDIEVIPRYAMMGDDRLAEEMQYVPVLMYVKPLSKAVSKDAIVRNVATSNWSHGTQWLDMLEHKTYRWQQYASHARPLPSFATEDALDSVIVAIVCPLGHIPGLNRSQEVEEPGPVG